ncbi:MAG: 5-amino-6-(D-ribitylamino)uracil--L-tyrosine 4-hydroxyphenyl transferase CofH [Pseudomonadota bacterium]|nr:5-amino-6-(D-ribitylamino)uracil--L-tyrosine 4-hydroxyphenyl transferase CofH [Pseudomonadota bacterium]
MRQLFDQALQGQTLSQQEALQLADCTDLSALMETAAALRDSAHRNVITYSRKVFIPLTHLCRDVCHYCTFAQTPSKIEQPYMSVEQVLDVAREGARQGCKEALFTLGEKPELRYNAARAALAELGFASTLEYVAHVAKAVFDETGLLPHINAGNMTAEEIACLRPVSASMGIMLESASSRLCEKGMPHYGSPDKDPALRLATIALAGEAKVPFTSGILIGIGESRRERIESLLALRDLHDRHGHLQEVIIQNFRAKPGTKMVNAPEPDLDDLLWTIAVARIVLGAAMNIQAPPNLSEAGVLPRLVDAGINDWGGVSPVTPDFVNPEAPWPHLQLLADETRRAGKHLDERLTLYPAYAQRPDTWLDPALRPAVLRLVDAEGFARTDSWETGAPTPPPAALLAMIPGGDRVPLASLRVSPDILELVARARRGERLDEAGVERLFQARGDDFAHVCAAADGVRRTLCGDRVSYVVTRNINYTNICTYKCQFCAFSKGKASENLRGKPYDLEQDEIARRTVEAWQRGGTEVCMQGGIHPDYTGQTYLDICHTVKAACPDMHIHAFSPLEVSQGAATLGLSVADFLRRLKDAGLGSLPGTAAEVLDDEVRAILCPDKVNTREWLDVIETAHGVGLKTTATIMFGHVDRPIHWARHLLRIRDLQARTGGITEFVPLPFVAMEAPLYRKGRARKGPTFRESILMHAVARLVLSPLIVNIQASWVKMGAEGVVACLNAGVNDLGGTLMNESITTAAGASHGQETSPREMIARIEGAGRTPWQRTTLYLPVSEERHRVGLAAGELAPTVNSLVDRKAARRGGPRRIDALDLTS